MDDREAQTPVVQDPELRRLVDLLPPAQRHLISRTFFGGSYLSVAARELGLDKRTARSLRDEGLAQLKEWLEDPPEEDPPLEDSCPFEDPLVWRCSVETEWGPCQQPARLEGNLCAAHAEWINSGITPDRGYERQVVLGLKEPIQSRLSQSEMDAVVGGRYRGDGRHLDIYTSHDPLEFS